MDLVRKSKGVEAEKKKLRGGERNRERGIWEDGGYATQFGEKPWRWIHRELLASLPRRTTLPSRGVSTGRGIFRPPGEEWISKETIMWVHSRYWRRRKKNGGKGQLETVP